MRAEYQDRQMAIGRVFARAFATIAAAPLAVFGIAFLFGALPGAAISLGLQALASVDAALGFTLAGVFAMLTSIAFSVTTQGALVRITVAHADGGRAAIGEALLAGLRAIVPLLGLGLVMTLAIGLGLAIFFVPGVMLFLMWSVAAPALVEERHGVFAALARSRELSRGARWKILALELVVFVFYWLIAAVIGIGAVFVVARIGGSTVAATLWGMIGTTFTAAIWGTIQTSLYVELRDWKDGPASERLADIFA